MMAVDPFSPVTIGPLTLKNRFIRSGEFANINETQWAARVRITRLVETRRVLIEPANDVVGYPSVKGAVETAQHVDVVDRHAVHLLSKTPMARRGRPLDYGSLREPSLGVTVGGVRR